MNVRVDINNIIKTFKKFYPDLNPKEIYKLDQGFLVVAPSTNETDYNDPNYVVKADLSKAYLYDMSNPKPMFKAFGQGPIWKK